MKIELEQLVPEYVCSLFIDGAHNDLDSTVLEERVVQCGQICVSKAELLAKHVSRTDTTI